MSARTTLKDVAREAGVSVSAASLALAGSRRISPATVQRVRVAAMALGYVRDQSQANAAAGHFRHAGKPALIAAWLEDTRALVKLRELAATRGMIVRAVTPGPAGLGAAVAALGAAAVVVQRRYLPSTGLGPLAVPVVMWCDEGEGDPRADLIETCEWWTASRQALARVRAAGYRRPLAVLMPARPPHWHDEVRHAALRSAGLPVLEWDQRPQPLLAFLDRHQPDAVIGGNIHVLRALQAAGRPLPFAALLTFDTPWHRACAGWREDPARRLGLTLELIEQRLRYGGRTPCRIIIAPCWQEGTSLPSANPEAGRATQQVAGGSRLPRRNR